MNGIDKYPANLYTFTINIKHFSFKENMDDYSKVFNNYYNPKRTPIAEITYEMPQGEIDGRRGWLDLAPNPIITVVYEDGRKTTFDTNLIFQRGVERGIEIKNNQIKRKLGLK
jgi:hypothetical protein